MKRWPLRKDFSVKLTCCDEAKATGAMALGGTRFSTYTGDKACYWILCPYCNEVTEKVIK